MSGLEIILPLIATAGTVMSGIVGATAQKQGAEMTAAAEKERQKIMEAQKQTERAQLSLNEDEYARRADLEAKNYAAAVGTENVSDSVLGAIMADASRAKSNREFNTAQNVMNIEGNIKDSKMRAHMAKFEGRTGSALTLLDTGVKAASGLNSAYSAYRTSSIYPTKTQVKDPYS